MESQAKRRIIGTLTLFRDFPLLSFFRGELDARVFQRAVDLGEGPDRPSDRTAAAFPALHGGQVDTGLLGAFALDKVQDIPGMTNRPFGRPLIADEGDREVSGRHIRTPRRRLSRPAHRRPSV